MKTVVCIDDSEVDINIVSQVIRRSGAAENIESFTDATVALDWFKTSQAEVDLILLDINMPKMNGFQFLVEFKKLERPETIVVCFVTTSENQEEIKKAETLGAKFTTKPLTRKKFTKLMADLF